MRKNFKHMQKIENNTNNLHIPIIQVQLSSRYCPTCLTYPPLFLLKHFKAYPRHHIVPLLKTALRISQNTDTFSYNHNAIMILRITRWFHLTFILYSKSKLSPKRLFLELACLIHIPKTSQSILWIYSRLLPPQFIISRHCRGYFSCSISFRACMGFWLYNYLSKTIFMLSLYLIDTLVDHRLLVWKSISLRILKALLHFCS